ncbi:MAG: flippase-like domain-containing protein, partial [Prevotella sp.]|nr:flippase-like domain-containing protein [Prevotella sp.]
MEQSKSFSIWKIVLPTLLGMGVIFYMLWSELFRNSENLETLKQISFSWNMLWGFAAALLLMAGRDLGFTIRYRYLTEKLLSWKQCLKITLLAEFGSAITPSSVGGGSGMAAFFLTKSNIPAGKSAAMVFVTFLLDELFFVVAFPLLLLFIPVGDLFSDISALETSILTLFVIAYL